MNVIVSQALATGLPVVATAHSGLPEQVLDGKCGVIAPENNPAALAERLRWMIEHPDRWPEQGRAGRAHVMAKYDGKRLMDQQLADYLRLTRRT